MRLLDSRASNLRDHIREQLLNVWHSLVHLEEEGAVSSITIREKLPNEPTSLSDTVVSFKSFKELDPISKKLWDNLHSVIFKRRTDIGIGPVPKFNVTEVSCTESSRRTIY